MPEVAATSNPPPAPIVKRCACGRSYTRAEFLALPEAAGGGRHVIDPGDGLPPDILEYRNCPCGSTLVIYAD